MAEVAPRALVVLRVARGAAQPTDDEVRAAIAADRTRLGLGPTVPLDCRIAGPYPVEVGGRSLDEWVAWEF